MLVFSFTLPMTKIAVRGMPPLVASMGRASASAVLALGALIASRSMRPSRIQACRLLWVVGGVVFGFPLLTAFALHHTASSHGSVVNGLLPLVTAGCAVVRAGERPSGRYWACSAVGLAAVIGYVIHEGGWTIHAADVVLLAAVLAAAVGYTEGALLARELGGWQVICWALVIGAPISVTLAAVSAARDGVHATPGQWAAFAYTAVGSMFLGFFAWYAGLARAGIARAGQLQLAQPALAILWGWPLLGERLTPAAIVTVVVVLVAVGVGRTAAVATAHGSEASDVDAPADVPAGPATLARPTRTERARRDHRAPLRMDDRPRHQTVEGVSPVADRDHGSTEGILTPPASPHPASPPNLLPMTEASGGHPRSLEVNLSGAGTPCVWLSTR